MWVTPYLERRSGDAALLAELKLDGYLFKNFTRMSKSDFEVLCNLIGPTAQKMNTNMRAAIPVTTKPAITLRFFAIGDSYTSLMYLFRVSKSSIALMIPEVCSALVEGLKDYIRNVINSLYKCTGCSRKIETVQHYM